MYTLYAYTHAELRQQFSDKKKKVKHSDSEDDIETEDSSSGPPYVAAVYYPAPTENASTLVYLHGNADQVIHTHTHI
jgi:hypothetical protein